MSFEDKLATLGGALVARGAKPWSVPASTVVLDEIAAAVRPLRLPAEVRRFWELVEPYTLGIETYPRLTDPAFALHTWRAHEETPGMVPRVLFPIAYESHAHMFVELHGPDLDDGGSLFQWAYCGYDFVLAHANIEALIDDTLRALSTPRLRTDEHNNMWIDPQAADPDTPGDLRTLVVHPFFGAVRTIPERVDAWPQVWHERSGVAPEHRPALGADHTIAEIHHATLAGPLSARVHATVDDVLGTAAGSTITISDHTGVLRLWCPTNMRGLAPRSGLTMEFDLVAARPTKTERDRDGLPDDISRVLPSLDSLHRLNTIARDIRAIATT